MIFMHVSAANEIRLVVRKDLKKKKKRKKSTLALFLKIDFGRKS